MDIVIVKGDFNERYINNIKCIDLSIYGNFINIEKIAWNICATYLLSSETLIYFDTLLKRGSAIITLQ